MKREIPLALKLSLAFIGAIVLAVLLVYFITAQSINRQFDIYRDANLDAFGQQLGSVLRSYYSATGSWLGVPDLLYMKVQIRIGDQIIHGNQLALPSRYILAGGSNNPIIPTAVDAPSGVPPIVVPLGVGLPLMIGSGAAERRV